MPWHAFRSKPFEQGRAEQELTRQGHEVLIPLVRRVTHSRGKTVERFSPLLWTYGFVRFGPSTRWQTIYSTRGVAGLVSPLSRDELPRGIPDEDIAALVERIRDLDMVAAPARIEPGVMVRIIYGPFEGLTCEVARDHGAWVDVLLRFVGGVRELPFSRGFVEEIGVEGERDRKRSRER